MTDERGSWTVDALTIACASPQQRSGLVDLAGTEDACPVQHVLVVDDDPLVTEVVEGYLERAGYAVDVADDGAAALDVAARWGSQSRPHPASTANRNQCGLGGAQAGEL